MISFIASPSNILNTTIGGGSTGLRSAEAEGESQQGFIIYLASSAEVVPGKLTLSTGSARSGTLWLLNNIQRVCNSSAVSSVSRRGTARLIRDRNYAGHFVILLVV